MTATLATSPTLTTSVLTAPQTVTLVQAERIFNQTGFRRTVQVVRDSLDMNKIRELIVRE